MKRFAMAIALVCVLVGTCFAGDIPGVPAPPPPSAAPAETEGDMGGGGFAEAITDEFVLAIFGVFAG
jgi:hypothetical protein